MCFQNRIFCPFNGALKWKIFSGYRKTSVGFLFFIYLFFLLTAKLEFALTVLKPEPQSDPPDQLFLLASTVLKKGDIQVL